MQKTADAAHPVLYFYVVVYSRIAIILPVSLCLKGEGMGESGCREKHRPEKIHSNLPNASTELLTFSNWYFPWNSVVSLHNSIIEPHLIDSDYTHSRLLTQRNPSICITSANYTQIWGAKKIRQTDRCSTSSAGRGNKHSPVSFSTWLHRRLQRFSWRCYLLKKFVWQRKLLPHQGCHRQKVCTFDFNS